MKLLIADDHTLFRDALLYYIERTEPDSEVMLAKDFHEVMDVMEGQSDLDLVLLDMRMPGMDGLQGLKKMRDHYPETQVALLSGMAEKRHIEEALRLGARGFFPKTMSGKAMLNGVHKIIDGEEFIAVDHNTNEYMASYYTGNDNGAPKGNGSTPHFEADIALTPRETDVLSFLLRGESNKDIARALDLQVVTVKLHVRGICRKLGAKNRTQAALKAQEMGLAGANPSVN